MLQIWNKKYEKNEKKNVEAFVNFSNNILWFTEEEKKEPQKAHKKGKKIYKKICEKNMEGINWKLLKSTILWKQILEDASILIDDYYD